MAQFRGIGDAATQVIQQQKDRDMRAAQLSEQARQFDVSRQQEDRQFAVQTGLRQQAAAEQSRQFDAEQAAAAQRQQAGLAEERRQFDATQGLRQAEFSRQQGIDEFRMGLEALTASTDLAAKDADTQLRMAQLKQYLAATQQEEQQRKSRETLAKGTFGSLALSAMMNGGVVPANALALANKEIGDAQNQVVGGGVDPDTGTAFFQFRGPDGTVTTKNMPPESQYALLRETYGDDVAAIFANKYKQNATVAAGIERARLAADKARLSAISGESASVAKRLTEMEKNLQTGTQEYADLQKRAKTYTAELDKSLGLGGEQQAAPAATAKDKLAQLTEGGTKVKEDVRKRFNLPPDAEARVNPSTGEVFVSFMKNGQRVSYILTE